MLYPSLLIAYCHCYTIPLQLHPQAQSEVLTCRAAAVAACVNFDHLI